MAIRSTVIPLGTKAGASAMGGVIESDDTQACADRLGFPVPLVMVLDRIINDGFRQLHAATAFALAWLENRRGADLSHIVSL